MSTLQVYNNKVRPVSTLNRHVLTFVSVLLDVGLLTGTNWTSRAFLDSHKIRQQHQTQPLITGHLVDVQVYRYMVLTYCYCIITTVVMK